MHSDREKRRRAMGLARVFKWPIWIAQLAGVVIATPVALTVLLLTVDWPGPLRFALGMGTFAGVGLAVYFLAFPRRTRQALEVFAWLGEREIDRFNEETESRFPGTRRSARRLLNEHHDLAEGMNQRVDLLLVAGEYDEAAETASRLPESTPWERFSREVQIEHVERVLGSNVERIEVRKAASELELPEERREADALLAWAEANRLALAGGDWRAPLVEARRQLGEHADGTLLRSRLIQAYGLILAVVGLFLTALHLL